MSGRQGQEVVSGDHLRETERGFIAMLRAKGFPAAWIDRHAIDLLAQASSEYVAWLKSHEPEENPVGWLITCAYRRAINLLDSQGRRAPSSSIEAACELADEVTPTPEQEALENDRQRQLREAIGALPPKDRRLISLVYFEDRSVREAGRRMGWGKSTADRHHQAALERLRSIVPERGLLSPAPLGLAAWAALAAEGGGGGFTRRLGEGARRLLLIAEPGGLVASSGVGRALGACGAGLAVTVCGLVAVGVQPTLPGSGGSSHREAAPRHLEAPPRPAPGREGFVVAPRASEPVGEAGQNRRGHGDQEARPAAPGAERPAERVSARPSPSPPPTPVAEEFGIEGAAPDEATSEPTPSAPSEPASEAPSRAREASGAQVSDEFGL